MVRWLIFWLVSWLVSFSWFSYLVDWYVCWPVAQLLSKLSKEVYDKLEPQLPLKYFNFLS